VPKLEQKQLREQRSQNIGSSLLFPPSPRDAILGLLKAEGRLGFTDIKYRLEERYSIHLKQNELKQLLEKLKAEGLVEEVGGVYRLTSRAYTSSNRALPLFSTSSVSPHTVTIMVSDRVSVNAVITTSALELLKSLYRKEMGPFTLALEATINELKSKHGIEGVLFLDYRDGELIVAELKDGILFHKGSYIVRAQ